MPRALPLALPAENEAVEPRRFGALTLFEARVRAVDPHFVLNDDAIPLAIDICRRLDGLPLAIELAAARVGTLGLAWDGDSDTVVIEAIAVGEYAADEPTEAELAELDRLRVRLTPAATRSFIARAKRVVSAGRAPCPFCGQPLDPAGHLCPRHNGYHR